MFVYEYRYTLTEGRLRGMIAGCKGSIVPLTCSTFLRCIKPLPFDLDYSCALASFGGWDIAPECTRARARFPLFWQQTHAGGNRLAERAGLLLQCRAALFQVKNSAGACLERISQARLVLRTCVLGRNWKTANLFGHQYLAGGRVAWPPSAMKFHSFHYRSSTLGDLWLSFIVIWYEQRHWSIACYLFFHRRFDIFESEVDDGSHKQSLRRSEFTGKAEQRGHRYSESHGGIDHCTEQVWRLRSESFRQWVSG